MHYWIYLTSLGTALVALRNLGCFHQTRPVVGIGSQIAKVLGGAGVGRAALRGRHEIIFLDRSVEHLLKTMALLWDLQIKPNTVVTAFSSFQLLIHLQKKIWLLTKTPFRQPWPRGCGGRVSGRGSGSSASCGCGKCRRASSCYQWCKLTPQCGLSMKFGPSYILCLVWNGQ